MKESYYKITKSLLIMLVLSMVCSVSFAQTDDRQPHYTGYNCSNCHGFEFGGTVYTDANGSSPVNGVQVHITGSNGNTATLTSNSYGNFWASSSSPVSPYTATVSYNGNTIAMNSSFSNGSCNGCHSNGSRIYIPSTQTPPTANFTGNPTSGDAPLTVNFTDQSSQGSGAITSWSWNFGDGGSSSNQNPSHNYSAVGTFSVTLTITDANGLSDSFTRTNYITANQSQFVPPTADFSGNPTSGEAPLTVNFTDLSTQGDGAIVGWNWNFGDGGSSSSQNPSHNYNYGGSFSVSMTVTDANGLSATSTQANMISVGGGQTTGEFVLIGWNDLGMHCMNKDHDVLSILPPYNTIVAQLVHRVDGSMFPDLVTSGYRIEYSIPGNTYSVGKTNFWDFAYDIFGVNLPDDVGLTGNGMTGEFEIVDDYFEATGIPITPWPDNDLVNEHPFQLIHLEAIDDVTGEVVATTDVTIPVSTEMDCNGCHGSFTEILYEHEDEDGFDPTDQPVFCGDCHEQNALGMPGNSEAKSLSYRMHKEHRDSGELFSIETCYNCHPGNSTDCLRGTMANDFDMICQDCHGTMYDVYLSIENGREPWVDEPSCGECHGEDHTENPGTLFRLSKGHGDLFCSACHGSTHAIYPSREENDNLQNIALQGHAGTLSDCSVCHAVTPSGEGPHGITVQPPDDSVIQTIPFGTEWNWFSINVEGDDMSLDNVLYSLGANATLIKNQTGFATYYADFGWYGLDAIDVTSMYMIQMTTSADLVFEGTAVDFVNTPISLSTGWNLIGYLPQTPNNLDNALSSIGENAALLKNQTEFATYYEGFGWYGMDSLNPGDGYMINMVASAELIYGIPDGLVRIDDKVEVDYHWTVDYRAFEHNMTITADVEIDGIQISEDDQLGVFVNGECRGTAVPTYFPLTDSYTINLMTYGETGDELSFRVYQSETNTEIEVLDNLTFEINGIIGNDIDPILLRAVVIPDEYSLSQNYPNPFNPSTTIRYQLPASGSVLLAIYNVNGQLVEELVNKQVEAGYHQITWNADNQPSGLYLVRITAGDYVSTQKMLLLK